MDALVTVANVLNVTGYFVRDRLWLRTLTFVATCCLLRYFSTRPEPLLEVVCWNLFFALVNAVVLGRLAVARLRRMAAGTH